MKVRVVVVEISVTVTVTADDVLDVKLLSPEYCAVIELVPTGKVVVEKRGQLRSASRFPFPGASCH